MLCKIHFWIGTTVLYPGRPVQYRTIPVSIFNTVCMCVPTLLVYFSLFCFTLVICCAVYLIYSEFIYLCFAARVQCVCVCGFVHCVLNVKHTVCKIHNTKSLCSYMRTSLLGTCVCAYLCIVKIGFVSTMDGKNARMYMRYVKSDDDITTVCGLLFIEFLCCGLIPSVTLSSIAMNMVKVFCVLCLYFPKQSGQGPISQAPEEETVGNSQNDGEIGPFLNIYED